MRNTVIFCYLVLTGLLLVLSVWFFTLGTLNIIHLSLLIAGVLVALGWLANKDVA